MKSTKKNTSKLSQAHGENNTPVYNIFGHQPSGLVPEAWKFDSELEVYSISIDVSRAESASDASKTTHAQLHFNPADAVNVVGQFKVVKDVAVIIDAVPDNITSSIVNQIVGNLKAGSVFTYSKPLTTYTNTTTNIGGRPMFHVADVLGGRKVYAGMLHGFKKVLYVGPPAQTVGGRGGRLLKKVRERRPR